MPMQPRSGTQNNVMPSSNGNNKPTWLLVRGLCRQQQHWENFPQQLAEQLDSHVLCSDIPGTGQQWQVATPTSITAIMLQLRNTFRQQHLHVSYPIRLLGISMGAMICTEWAKHFPNEIEKMVFINTSFKQFSPLHQRLKLHNVPTLLKILTSPALQQEQLILRMTSHTASHNQHYHTQVNNHQALAQRWADYAVQQPVSRQNALRQLVAASRFISPTQAPIEPILLLASSRDQLVDVNCSTVIAKQWQCPIYYHPTAGHDLPLDDSDWVCQTISRWLKN
ncbi:alpha/beta hydrolase [Moritella marina ATCC 15381]|uniref:Alpha/beta hydrolase n=1 Tax=Moritella marina ATCC 15381 TaxID=1202962 RepID=A0A5J6WM55_MORMI|nr:alpha/beta hydrolase [Moritella marina]QFI39127.1 alpha/beta hydrolase [Moritella marina ATCC 15381]